MSDNFESFFADFLDRREYDQAENALFSMVRISFTAGWLAAGGNPPKAQHIIKLVHKEITDTSDDIPSEIALRDGKKSIFPEGRGKPMKDKE